MGSIQKKEFSGSSKNIRKEGQTQFGDGTAAAVQAVQDSFQRAKSIGSSVRRRTRTLSGSLKSGATVEQIPISSDGGGESYPQPNAMEQSRAQAAGQQDKYTSGQALVSPRLGDQRSTVVHFHTPSGLSSSVPLAQPSLSNGHAPCSDPAPAEAAGDYSTIPVASNSHGTQDGGSDPVLNRDSQTLAGAASAGSAAAAAAAAATVSAAAASAKVAAGKLEGVIERLERLLMSAEGGATAASAAERLASENARLAGDLRAALHAASAVCDFVNSGRNHGGGFIGPGRLEEEGKDKDKDTKDKDTVMVSSLAAGVIRALGTTRETEAKVAVVELALANERAKVVQ